MSTELSMLNLAERGESHRSHPQEQRVRADEGDLQRTSQPIVSAQAPAAQLQIEDLEHASGPTGLARVKDYDRRFAFYPSFSEERSLALEHRAKCIYRLSTEIQTLSNQLKSVDASQPSNLSPTCSAEARLEGLMSQLADTLAQYDTAWAHAKTVDTADRPEESSLDELRIWLCERSGDQVELYRSKEWHQFRLLALPKGPIERLVKAIMPISKLGRVMLRPFRSPHVHAEDLQFQRYEDVDLSRVVSILVLAGISVFLLLPLALLSYFETNRNFTVALAVMMCFLVSVFARFMEPDEARQVLFVCVYSAVMSAFLSQLS